MKESTTNEISDLFQELIVSKIKGEIEILKQYIGESFEDNEDKVNKLPKSSFIKQIVESEQTEVIDHIDQIVKNSKSEKYLNEIFEYLKKQYGFADDKTLCMFLDELQETSLFISEQVASVKQIANESKTEEQLNGIIEYLRTQYGFSEAETLCDFLEEYSKETATKIDSLVKGQGSFKEKYDAIVSIIEQFKNDVLSETGRNNELLRKMEQQFEKQCNEKIANILSIDNKEIEILNRLECSADDISTKLNNNDVKIDELLSKVTSDSELVSLLRVISSNVAYESDGQGHSAIKKDFIEIGNAVNELLEYSRKQENIIFQYVEEYEKKEIESEKQIKLLLIGNVMSLIGIIVMIVVQFL